MDIDFTHLKHVFIDFDGTLVDSIPMLYQNYITFLKTFAKTGSREEFEALTGPTIKEFIPLLAQRHGLENGHDELYDCYIEELQGTYHAVQLMPNARVFLELLKRLKLPATLVTSSHLVLIESSLEHLKLREYFQTIVTGDMVNRTKPDPEIYELALKKNHLKPVQALAVEDSYSGSLSAITANIPTIGLQQAEHVTLSPQVFRVKSWREIIDLFEAAYA